MEFLAILESEVEKLSHRLTVDLVPQLTTLRQIQRRESIGEQIPEKTNVFAAVTTLTESLNEGLRNVRYEVRRWTTQNSASLAGSHLEERVRLLVERCNLISNAILQKSLVVTSQPSPMLKQQRNIEPIEIRFLVPNKILNVAKSEVRLHIIGEDESKLLNSGTAPLREVLENKNNTLIIGEDAKSVPAKCRPFLVRQEDKEENSHYGVIFDKLKVVGRHEATKGDREQRATAVKYCFLAVAKMTCVYEGEQLETTLHTTSLPFVYSVGQKQDCDCHAVALWDSAFGIEDPMTSAAESPDEVPWVDFARMLACWWSKKTGSVKRPLGESDLMYFQARLYGLHEKDCSGGGHHLRISRKRIFNDPLSAEITFSFWDWLYHAAKLMSPKKLGRLWEAGLIYGFASKQQTEEVLRRSAVPCFLIRFPESLKHCVSVSVLGPLTQEVVHVEPYYSSEFKDLPAFAKLVKRLDLVQELEYIYPERKKEDLLSYAETTVNNQLKQQWPYLPKHAADIVKVPVRHVSGEVWLVPVSAEINRQLGRTTTSSTVDTPVDSPQSSLGVCSEHDVAASPVQVPPSADPAGYSLDEIMDVIQPENWFGTHNGPSTGQTGAGFCTVHSCTPAWSPPQEYESL
jgi:hypothetical protein